MEDITSENNLSEEAIQQHQEPEDNTKLEHYLERFKKIKRNNAKTSSDQASKVTINIRKEVMIQRGFFMLPKEIIVELLAYQHIILKQYGNSGRNDYYYKCANENCKYRMKIVENKSLLQTLNTVTLLQNCKSFDLNNESELKEGISEITEYGKHEVDHGQNKEGSDQEGIFLLMFSYFFLGLSHFSKLIISYDKLYLLSPKKSQLKLQKIIVDNHLEFNVPTILQLQNYLYRTKVKLIAENYPEVKKYLSEICNKKFSPSLNEDETFIIYYKCEDGELSVLLSTKALIKNLINQAKLQPSFIHLDGTYKLIDLGLPVLTLSTETLKHNYRPVCFYITWSESTEQVTIMLRELSSFVKDNFNFNLKPKFVLTDNSDAFISGCKSFFNHKYTHLQCHFHLSQRIEQKLKSKLFEETQDCIWFGVKTLKNSESQKFFQHVWSLIKDYWKKKNVPEKFISAFENEYVRKATEWHYGSAFPGKSRSNNSVESGNKVLKDHFNRKAHNIKEFIGKLKDFLREYSTLDKTKFPEEIEYDEKIKQLAIKLIQDNKYLESDKKPGFLYFPRKGINIEGLEEMLEIRIKRKGLPKNIDELFKAWGHFRTLNVDDEICDCCYYFKYGYCKHVLALKHLKGELQDTELKKKKKPGRKPLITKALQK